jgi:hypothetical protein
VTKGRDGLKSGKRTLLPLAQAKSFELYERREIALAASDAVRITKNFRCGVERFTNNELCRVAAIGQAGIRLDDARLIRVAEEVHLDQGIAVTSHASQGKTVDQVIISVPVSAFSQANEAQFYVSMSRARTSMHLFTDSKVALKEAVTRPGDRLSPCEMISKKDDGLGWRNLTTAIHRALLPGRNPVTRLQAGREPVKETEREIQR